MKFLGAFLCLIVVAQAANIERVKRDTADGLVAPIVEEILKVEIKADLKKNNVVEIDEKEPVVVEVKKEEIVVPIESRTADEVVSVEEKKVPEMVESSVVKEDVPQVVEETRTVEKVPEIVETVIVEEVKPVENLRTEDVPSVEQPVVEIVKETVVIEPVSELRQEPVASVEIREEIVKPVAEEVRTVPEKKEEEEVKSEVMPEMPKDEVKSDVMPEMVKEEEKSEVVPEMPKEEVRIDSMPEMLKEDVKSEVVPEMPKEEAKSDVMPEPVMSEMKAEEVPELPKSEPVVAEVKEEMKVEPEMKDEVKTVVDEEPKNVEPMMDEMMPEIRQQNIIAQVQQALSNAPVIGPLLNRNTQAPNDEPAPTTIASDTPQEASADATTTTKRPNRPILNAIQGLTNQVQTALGITPTQNDEVQDTQQPASPLETIQNVVGNIQTSLTSGFQNAVNTLTNVFSPPAAAGSTPTKTDEKPVDETTVVVEEQKSVDEPTVDVQKEENKIEEEEQKEKISQE